MKTYALLLLALITVSSIRAQSLVISQVYASNGTGNTYKNDYIELFNPAASAITFGNWSVQYIGTTGTWNKVDLPAGTSIPPGRYYLIQVPGNGKGPFLPATADLINNTNSSIAAPNGTVALVTTTTIIAANACPPSASLIDKVGYGASACSLGMPAGAISNTNVLMRNSGGCINTSDNNNDFTITVANPRNSASAANICSSSSTNRTITTLPVRLTQFRVQKADSDKAVITWQVNEELNFHHYEVEYSIDGKNFISKEVVLPQEGQGLKMYQSKISLTGGITKHFFRLKMVDKDQSVKYSAVATLDAAVEDNKLFVLKINPATSETALALFLNEDKRVVIEVISPVGQVVYKKEVSSVKATPLVSINGLEQYGKGICYVRVSTSGGQSQTQKLLIQ